MTSFKTRYNYDPQEVDYEVILGHSCTIPDESIPIRDLLAKHTSGINLPLAKTEIWDDNPDYDKVDLSLDPEFELSDVSVLREVTERSLGEAKTQRELAKKAKSEQDKADLEAYKAILAERDKRSAEPKDPPS